MPTVFFSDFKEKLEKDVKAQIQELKEVIEKLKSATSGDRGQSSLAQNQEAQPERILAAKVANESSRELAERKQILSGLAFWKAKQMMRKKELGKILLF